MKLRGVKATLIMVLMVAFYTGAFSQDQSFLSPESLPKDWFLRDPQADNLQGISVEKAYETILKGKPSRTIIVAVVDSGVDIDHEDLKDVIWTNTGEIAGNGLDDDKNGYADDVHGWNFIGGKDGNVDADTYELTREYARLKAKYEAADSKTIRKNKAEHAYWLKIKEKFERLSAYNKDILQKSLQEFMLYSNLNETIAYCDSVAKSQLNTEEVTQSSLANFNATNDTLLFVKNTLEKIFQNIEPGTILGEFQGELSAYLESLDKQVERYQTIVDKGYNPDYDTRKIIGDNYSDSFEKYYGNKDVKGGDPTHGTHVAGIIAANRKNDIGMKGIADNVLIMPVRVVPNGDERDKDVANGIIYAVDNGAHIINMSFGKDYSPQKEAVDRAVKYAESKGVLLVHAAGNDGDNIDAESNYPSRFYSTKKESPVWIEVGASAWGTDENFVASFSNFGKRTVDFFAPGVEIYSTQPGNQYKASQGTSFASPAVAGVAALLMSYYPHLTATQVRDILRQSSRKFDNLKVKRPDTQEDANFSDLSITGGIINAYEAVTLAEKSKSADSKD